VARGPCRPDFTARKFADREAATVDSADYTVDDLVHVPQFRTESNHSAVTLRIEDHMAKLRKFVQHPSSLLGTAFGVNWHALRLYRLAERLRARNHHELASVLLAIGRIISGIEIVAGAEIGEGTFFQHGNGIVIGPGVRIGKRCALLQQVTFGTRDGVTYPTVGDDVIVNAGAKVLGNITIGNGAIIGANAVVLVDVAPGAIVAGVPARVVSHKM
jgi:serine acetyltransferase